MGSHSRSLQPKKTQIVKVDPMENASRKIVTWSVKMSRFLKSRICETTLWLTVSCREATTRIQPSCSIHAATSSDPFEFVVVDPGSLVGPRKTNKLQLLS